VPANSPIEVQFLKKLTELTEANLTNEQFGVSELAREMNMSRSNLHRKVILITKTSVSQFIRQHRLKRAMEMLQQTALTVSEVAYNVGFGSVTYFTKCFHDYFGFPPGEVGKRNLEESGLNEQTVDNKQVNSVKRLKIALVLASLLVIISVIALFIVFKPFSGGKNKLEKTIAVLPFVDYSPASGNSYIISGLREEILDKLEKIEDLDVKSRTDVEKYKDTKLSISQIAKELKVNFILEGSGQKVQDKIRIRLQLIETATGNHLWSKPFEEEVNDKTIFDIQEEVALSVANELGAVITPKEKTQVAKKPTQNLAAYNYYLRGIEYMKLFNVSWNWEEAHKGKQNFKQAIKLDTTFAEAYVRLGSFYIDGISYSVNSELLRQQYLDSGLMMANKALLYDEKNHWAYWLRGTYYERKGLFDKAEEEFAKSAKFYKGNINILYMSYFYRFYGKGEYYNALDNYYKYQETKTEENESERSMLLNVCGCFYNLGYPQTAKLYCQKFLNQYNDSLRYFSIMADIESFSGNFKSAVNYELKWHEIATSKTTSLYYLISELVLCRDYISAYKYLLEMEHEYSKSGKDLLPNIYCGYTYLKNGEPKKADYHLKGSAKKYLKQIELNEIGAQQFYSYWYLARIYSVMGEKRKALDNLKMWNKRKTNYILEVTQLKYNPMWDNIRQEPEFADVLKDVEAKYQKEHERAGKLLKEYGELK